MENDQPAAQGKRAKQARRTKQKRSASLMRAARSLEICNTPFAASRVPLDICADLERALQSGEPAGHTPAPCADILLGQAAVLDAVFNRLLAKALVAPPAYDDKPNFNYTHSDYLDFALRAQKQCRNTIEAVLALRGPMAKSGKQTERP